MSLRKIMVCQNEGCQTRGAKSVLHHIEQSIQETFSQKYPDLRIEIGDCQGDCEMGPIIKVNDSLILRGVNEEMIDTLLRNPESVLGEVMHVLEQDRDTFERIIKGELF